MSVISMCIMCHFSCSVEKTLEDLESEIKSPKFEVWNSASISHLLISITGIDGPRVKELALELMERYIVWIKANPEKYGKESIFEMPDISHLEFVYDQAKTTPIPVDWEDMRKQAESQISHD